MSRLRLCQHARYIRGRANRWLCKKACKQIEPGLDCYPLKCGEYEARKDDRQGEGSYYGDGGKMGVPRGFHQNLLGRYGM